MLKENVIMGPTAASYYIDVKVLGCKIKKRLHKFDSHGTYPRMTQKLFSNEIGFNL